MTIISVLRVPFRTLETRETARSRKLIHDAVYQIANMYYAYMLGLKVGPVH